MTYRNRNAMADDSKMVPETKNGIGTRLETVVARLGGIAQVAKTTDLSPSTLRRYINEETDVKLGDAARLCRMAGFSLEWLADGTGEPGGDIAVETEPDDYALIPGYNVQVSAGNGSAINEEQVTRKLAFRRKWLNFRGLHEKNLVVVFAKGDSMEPTISDNNTIMVDTSDNVPQDGRMYVIRVDDHLLVKRTQIVPGQGVQLISDNKDYPPMLVKLGNAETTIEFVGRVVWIGKDV